MQRAMAQVRFTDDRGIEWEVVEVGGRIAPADHRPARGSAAGRRAAPWLCFESATQRRRLDRFPAWWHALPARDLAELCREATPDRLPRPVLPWAPQRVRDLPDGGR